MHKLIAVTLILLLLSTFNIAAAQDEATPVDIVSPDSEPEYDAPLANEGSVLLDLRFLDFSYFIWQRDDVCTAAFKGYDVQPELIVYSDQGDIVLTQEIWNIEGDAGFRYMTEEELEAQEQNEFSTGIDYRVSGCQVVVSLDDIPNEETYRLVIDPILDTELSLEERSVHTLEFRSDLLPLPTIYERPAGQIGNSELYRIAGTFELTGEPLQDYFGLPLFGCGGLGGYDDIKPGAQIRIEDESGTILAIAELTDQSFENYDRCLFTFTAEVPEAKFYSISMGRRGELVYSFEQMEEADWRVDLVI